MVNIGTPPDPLAAITTNDTKNVTKGPVYSRQLGDNISNRALFTTISEVSE